jgi:ribonuclease HI
MLEVVATFVEVVFPACSVDREGVTCTVVQAPPHLLRTSNACFTPPLMRFIARLFARPLRLSRRLIRPFPFTLFAEPPDADTAMSTTSSGKRKRAAGKFYAVRKGRTPGIYHSWPDYQQQTDRFRNPEFKSFPTLDAAEAFMKEGKRDASAPISLRGDLSESCSLPADKGSKVGIHASKKQKKENGLPIVANGDAKWEPGLGPLPPDAQDGFDPTLKLDADTGGIRYKTDQEMSATKLQPTGEFSGPIVVYTDGSSLGNGGVGAVGGVGVYFGPNDKR